MDTHILNGNGKPAPLLKAIADFVQADQAAADMIAKTLRQAGGQRIVWSEDAQKVTLLAARSAMMMSLISEMGRTINVVHNLLLNQIKGYAQKGEVIPIKIGFSKKLSVEQQAAVDALLALGLPADCLKDETDGPGIILAKG